MKNVMLPNSVTIAVVALAGIAAIARAEPEFKHVVVYQEDGKFAGWPANNGAWVFEGDEMLVGFTRGEYELHKGHNIGPKDSQKSWLARSTDGGETWEAYDPEGYVGDCVVTPKCGKPEAPIDFTHPEFAMRVVGTAYHGASDRNGHFFYSYDGGAAWKGPHRLGEIHKSKVLHEVNLEELTPRTDYVVLGKHEALVMVSARRTNKFGSDKIFCARTRDGGMTFEFLDWVVPVDDPARAVMPETFRMKDGTLVTAMRRRMGKENWVDAYSSSDNGESWQFMARIGDAGAGNGNPPAIAATADGRLCAVFGERTEGRILATYSSDGGKTWDEPFVLRDDFGSEDGETDDLGYPRLLRRSDGKMVALYYYSTVDCLHHIAATIWDPGERKMNGAESTNPR